MGAIAQAEPGHASSMPHGHRVIRWKQCVAAIGIAALASFCLYETIWSWLHGRVGEGLFALGNLGVAPAVYAFGYFWCVPEVIGGGPLTPERTLSRRWSDLTLLAVFVATIAINAGYLRIICEYYTDIVLWHALALLAVSAWLLISTGVAAGRYLVETMPGGEVTDNKGWRARVRRVMDRTGSPLVRLLRDRRALGIGGGSVLLSLVLPVQSDIVFGPSCRGYEIVTGTGAWIYARAWSSDTISFPEIFLLQLFRIVYVMAVVLAALAAISASDGRVARLLRSSRSLCIPSGIIALFELTELAGFSLYNGPFGLPFAFAVFALIVMWIAPIAIWIEERARFDGQRAKHSSVAVMVYYMPIFLLAFAFLPLHTYFAGGFGLFIVGMLLVWWGFVTSGREIAKS